jgi:integrase
MSNRVPSYRCKKSNGREYGCVSLPDGMGGRRDILLGTYGTRESRAEYARVVGEWEAGGRQLPQPGAAKDHSINELILAYWPHAEQHYRHADGTASQELAGFRLTFRPLKEMYGHTAAKDFGPMALKSLRERLIAQPIVSRIKVEDPATGKKVWQERVVRVGLARGVINQRIARIKRLFKWGASNELVPIAVFQALATVSGLQRGRTKARETAKVRPVSIALVEDTLQHVPTLVADMLSLQLATGMRSGETCIMRGCDIDVSGPIWLYRPSSHKNLHREMGRVVPLGPKAQEIVKRYLKPSMESYLFSPRDSVQAWREQQRAKRKSKVQPSQVCRRKRKPQRMPGERYTPTAMAHAVRRACDKHGLPRWHPHQLRHTAATEIRREYGLDATRAVLGQHGLQIAAEYGELDLAKVVAVAAKLG